MFSCGRLFHFFIGITNFMARFSVCARHPNPMIFNITAGISIRGISIFPDTGNSHRHLVGGQRQKNGLSFMHPSTSVLVFGSRPWANWCSLAQAERY
ncbi:hypothetical protein Q9966_003502 [Columba livia]|nr:hypothetical protein Q9966_003502 [Columba livia]